MRPDSDWLRTLAGDMPQIEPWRSTSPHDNYVLPQVNLGWPGSPQRTLDGLGHLAMLFSPRVAQALLEALAAGGAGHPLNGRRRR